MDEELINTLSEMDDEYGQRSTSPARFFDDLDINTKDDHSALGEEFCGWDPDFTSMETFNGSIGDKSLNNGCEFKFGSNYVLESNKSTEFLVLGEWKGDSSSISPDWEEKYSEFDFRLVTGLCWQLNFNAFKKCRDGYLMDSLKDHAELFLNALENFTDKDGKQSVSNSNESKVKMLEKKVRELQEKNLKLAFTRDLLLERALKPKKDFRHKILEDKLRYANSVAKLTSRKKNSVEEDLKRNKRQMQFIQTRLCDIDQENYRLKKENGQLKLMIQNLLTNKTCKHHRDKSTTEYKEKHSAKFNSCSHCVVLKSLREKGYILRHDGTLIKTKISNASDGDTKEFESFNLIEDDDLEVDGVSEKKEEKEDTSNAE